MIFGKLIFLFAYKIAIGMIWYPNNQKVFFDFMFFFFKYKWLLIYMKGKFCWIYKIKLTKYCVRSICCILCTIDAIYSVNIYFIVGIYFRYHFTMTYTCQITGGEEIGTHIYAVSNGIVIWFVTCIMWHVDDWEEW